MPGFSSEGYTPVPYDFDYSGLVDAYYAEPGETLGISSVTQRYYLGPCAEDEAFLKSIQYLKAHKDEMMDMLHAFPYLRKGAKDRVIAYIEQYFLAAESPEFIGRNLRTTCR